MYDDRIICWFNNEKHNGYNYWLAGLLVFNLTASQKRKTRIALKEIMSTSDLYIG